MPLVYHVQQVQPWKKWGPYLSERQWGTVREDYSEGGNAWDYFTHDQAQWVAALEAGAVLLPAPQEMARVIRKDRELTMRLYPDSPRYALELDPRSYRAALAADMRRTAGR